MIELIKHYLETAQYVKDDFNRHSYSKHKAILDSSLSYFEGVLDDEVPFIDLHSTDEFERNLLNFKDYVIVYIAEYDLTTLDYMLVKIDKIHDLFNMLKTNYLLNAIDNCKLEIKRLEKLIPNQDK